MARTGKKLDLIPELTTHKNDYKPWPIPKHNAPPKAKLFQGTVKPKQPVKYPQLDYQSHFEYQARVPFDLHIVPDPITGQNPWCRRKTIEKSEEAIQPTDRLVLKIPGKSELELTDEEIIRNVLVSTYSQTHRKLYAEASLKVPNPPEKAKSVLINDDVRFKPKLYPPLALGWVNAAKHWDCLQNRILVDPTRTFWLRKGPEVECFSRTNINDIIPNETKQEIRCLIEEDRLRLPFMKTVKGYQGYRQIAAKGVPLARSKDFDF
ncbi:UNVERIFIED_CONTAM: hypothetical protein PYX00_007368 [Menopon gallinae]|uniref:Uncharacterized protein n=1 Tax=Menopon gallinae TaxID=328185 RepID=A0AAW2HIW2_9NEOP